MHRKKTDVINTNRFPLWMQEKKHKPQNSWLCFPPKNKEKVPLEAGLIYFNYGIFTEVRAVMHYLEHVIEFCE